MTPPTYIYPPAPLPPQPGAVMRRSNLVANPHLLHAILWYGGRSYSGVIRWRDDALPPTIFQLVENLTLFPGQWREIVPGAAVVAAQGPAAKGRDSAGEPAA